MTLVFDLIYPDPIFKLISFNFFVSQAPQNDSEVLVKYLFPLLSPIVVLLTLGVNTFINYKMRDWDRIRAWNMKALVEPNIKGIIEFYTETHKLIKVGIESIDKADTDLLSVQAQVNSNFQKIKRRFELDVIQMMESTKRFQAEGKLLSQILRDLEDQYTIFFDVQDFSSEAIEKLEDLISANKVKFLNTLYLLVN